MSGRTGEELISLTGADAASRRPHRLDGVDDVALERDERDGERGAFEGGSCLPRVPLRTSSSERECRGSDHDFGRDAEHLGHAPVGERRGQLGVEGPDAFFGSLDDAAVLRLGLDEKPVDPVAVRDVAHRERDPADVGIVTEVVADDLHGEPVAVRVLDPDEERLTRIRPVAPDALQRRQARI